MFVGRKQELAFLEERYQSSRAELIVLYGRRRIGKTELLRQFAKGKDAVFYACTECPDSEQLARFSGRMLATGMPAGRYISQFSDWEAAFRSVTELPMTGKKLLIIDEFPYMVQGNTSIPSVLQNLWDELLQHEQVMLVKKEYASRGDLPDRLLVMNRYAFTENDTLALRDYRISCP